MKAKRPLLFCALITVIVFPARADENLRGIFVTVHSGNGGTCLLDLHVPKTGGGRCELRGVTIAVMPTMPMSFTHPPLPELYSGGAGSVIETLGTPTYHPPFQSQTGVSTQVAMEMSQDSLILPFIGSLTTRDSNTYTNCRLVAFQTDSVIVLHDAGLSKILFSDLDAASRARIELLR